MKQWSQWNGARRSKWANEWESGNVLTRSLTSIWHNSTHSVMDRWMDRRTYVRTHPLYKCKDAKKKEEHLGSGADKLPIKYNLVRLSLSLIDSDCLIWVNVIIYVSPTMIWNPANGVIKNHLCTMISDVPTNGQMSEQSKWRPFKRWCFQHSRS